MIKINLLPFRAARKKENVRRQISVFLLFFTLVFLGLLFYHFQLSAKVNKVQKELTTTKATLAKFEKQAAEVDRINAQLKALDQKIEIMAQLNTDRTAPVEMLSALAALSVKGRMWITNLKDNPGSVTLTGVAMDNKTVATFMARVEKSDFFSGAELYKVIRADVAGLKLKQFNMRCLKAGLKKK